tara:strand:- start:19679 stop:21859 length:2181 start_codon:yes stop_codon:yes gene_type:complete
MADFYRFGDYLLYSERITKIRYVISKTNGEDVDSNASLALTSLGGGGLVDNTADAITNVLPFQEWRALRLGTPHRNFTTYLQQQINSLTSSTYWRAASTTNDSLSLEYTGDGANWGSSLAGTSIGSSGNLDAISPSQKRIVLLFTSTMEGTEKAYKLYGGESTTGGGFVFPILTTADGSNTNKREIFTLESHMHTPLTSQGTPLKRQITEFAVKNMPGSSGANLSGYEFNINTNLYQAGSNGIIENTISSNFTAGQNFADEDNFDYSENGGFDSSVADTLDTNAQLATQLRSMLAGNSSLNSLTFGAVTDSGIADGVGNGTTNINYFTITGAADGTPFGLSSVPSAARAVRKFTNNNIDNAGTFQAIFKDLDFNQPGLMKNIYKVYVRWRVKDHEDDMSKTYVKAFFGIDGENLEQTGHGRTFNTTKSLNYDADGLVWHEDTSDIKTTTISDALRNDPIDGFTDTTCDTDHAATDVTSTAAYAVGITSQMTFDAADGGGGAPSPNAVTEFPVGSLLVNSDGVTIGTVTASDATHITCSGGIEVAIANNDRMYNSKTINCDESDSIAVPQSVSGTGIPDDTYVTSVSEEGAVTFFNINNAATADNDNQTFTFKSNRVTVDSIDNIKRGDAGMIKTTTGSERMLLNPFNEQDKIVKLFRPYQSGVAAHASGATLYIFPKTKSYISELIPTDSIRNVNSFQLKLENGAGVPAHFEIEDITIIYRMKGTR